MNEVPQEVVVPTIEQLTAQIQQLTCQRSAAKDQVEQLEKQLPVLAGMLQLLQAQEKREQQEAEKAEAAVNQD